MRRGLQRAGGFALYIAVCNSPATTRELIRLLRESMPGVDIETVTLDESINHPLEAVLAQVDRSQGGPVMIVGLERSIPSDAAEHPMLDALNLSRPDWAKELPRPLVLWVPDYLLGLMGRETPDFLDWRSDTLFFPDSPGEDLTILDSELWRGRMRNSMPEAQRRARIEELRSRLMRNRNSEDLVILAACAEWLRELGHHLMFFGEWSAARESLSQSLKVEEKLGRRDEVANVLGDIAIADLEMGEVDKAEERFRRALALHEEAGNDQGQATDLANIAGLKLRSGFLEDSEDLCRKALKLSEDSGLDDLLPSFYNLLLGIKLVQGDLSEAREVAEKALSIAAKGSSSLRRYELLNFQGSLSWREGDLARAEQFYEQALEIAKLLGNRVGLANTLFNLGGIYMQTERSAQAEKFLRQARDLYDQLERIGRRDRADKLLQQLSPPSPQSQ